MKAASPSDQISPILFGMPRFATMFYYTALVNLSLPLVIVTKVGEDSKGFYLGMVTGGAAILSVVLLYGFGIYRDREERIRQGSNYPLYGLALSLPALLTISVSELYPSLIAAFLVLIIARSFCESCHLSVLTDRPKLANRGHYTSGITLWHFLGTGLGALAFGFLPEIESFPGMSLSSGLASLSMAIVVLCMIGFFLNFYRPGADAIPRPDSREEKIPLKIPGNLQNLIIARFFLLAGILMIATFLVYLVLDYLGAEETKKTASLLYFWSIMGAVISAWPAGKLIQRKGEIPVLAISGSALALVTASFFLLGPVFPQLTVPCMIIYGSGFAGVIAAGLSLTVKLIPHPRMSGRIMAIIASSTFLAQALASLSGALLLDPLNRIGENLGYVGLFVIIEIYFFLGGFFLFRIKP